MNRLKLWIVAALAAALALSMFASTSAQVPQPPSAFRGTLTGADGDAVQTGLEVTAYINGIDCTEKTIPTFTLDGATQYFIRVAHDSQIPGCGLPGDTVSFRVGSYGATPTATFGGGLTWVDLTLTDRVVGAVRINVAVWRRNETPFNALANLYISTQVPGKKWKTHNTPLVMSPYISSNGVHRWDRSDLRAVEVTLGDGSPVTINVGVWRRVSDPTILYISTQAPGEGWETHDDDGPLNMEVNETGNYYRSDLTPIVVQLQ